MIVYGLGGGREVEGREGVITKGHVETFGGDCYVCHVDSFGLYTYVYVCQNL